MMKDDQVKETTCKMGEEETTTTKTPSSTRARRAPNAAEEKSEHHERSLLGSFLRTTWGSLCHRKSHLPRSQHNKPRDRNSSSSSKSPEEQRIRRICTQQAQKQKQERQQRLQEFQFLLGTDSFTRAPPSNNNKKNKLPGEDEEDDTPPSAPFWRNPLTPAEYHQMEMLQFTGQVSEERSVWEVLHERRRSSS